MSASKFMGLVGALATVLALTSAFETFTEIGLFYRLLATAIAAVPLGILSADWLSNWARPENEALGIRPARQRKSRRAKLFTAALGLAALSGLGVFFSLFQTERFVFSVEFAERNQMSTAILSAPLRAVKSVTVPLPPAATHNCDWSDNHASSVPRLDVRVVDWDSPNRKLEIDNFDYPQAVKVSCSPNYPFVRDIRVSPASTEIFLDTELSTWRLWIIILGGVLWLGLLFRQEVLSR